MSIIEFTKLLPGMKDKTGRVVGRLTVLGYAGKVGKYNYWMCKCSCGNIVKLMATSLYGGNTNSCGCIVKEGKIKHGACRNNARTTEYISWNQMIARCTRKKYKKYKWYGGKGITICENYRGKDGFINFLTDLGYKPTSKHTLDRIDFNGHYSCGHCHQCIVNNWPVNCRWLTQQEQARNTSFNVNITYNGKTQCISAWAIEKGINRSTLQKRLVSGWAIRDAIETPINEKMRNHKTKVGLTN